MLNCKHYYKTSANKGPGVNHTSKKIRYDMNKKEIFCW